MARYPHASFDIQISSLIRHSDFELRHSTRKRHQGMFSLRHGGLVRLLRLRNIAWFDRTLLWWLFCGGRCGCWSN
jgi:hypothetical protein